MGNQRNPSAQTHPIRLPEPGVLERNPYEWTLMRTAREAGSLGLLTHALVLSFAVMLVASVATSHWQAGFITAFFTAFAIHLLTKLRFAVEATRQINVDRQSGALELLLVTTLPNNGILEGHKRALRTLARKPMVLLIGLNLLLEMCVLLCPETLHMDPEATLMFSTFFLGGMVLAAADFSALRCLGLLHGLRAPGHVRAALGAFSSTMLLPWIGMGLILAVVSSTNPRPTGFAAILSLWTVVCLLYDWFLARSASTQLQAGLRRLASEGF